MPRKPEFDRQKALESAMKLFWRRGFHASSLPELLDATGLSRSSFYATFIDKRSLYAECLELFGDRTRSILRLERHDAEPLRSVSGFFRRTVCEVPRERVAWGCLMVNTVLELADSNNDMNNGLHRQALRLLSRMEKDFEALFNQAQALGQLDDRFSPRELAAHIMTINQGLRVQSRQKMTSNDLESTLVTSLTLAGIPA